MSKKLYLQSDDLEGLWPLKSDGKMTVAKKKLISIVDYQHALTLPTSSVRPSFSPEGFRQGYVEHAPLEVTRAIDVCSPFLMRTMLNRVVLKNLQLMSCEMIKDTDDVSYPTPVWIIRMEHVVVSDYRYGSTESVGNGERIQFRYRSVGWFIRPVKLDDRQPGPAQTAGWNGKTNQAEDIVDGMPDFYDDLMTIIKS